MSRQPSNNIQVKHSNSGTHWVWHLLILAAAVFCVVALIVDVSFVERWISSDGHVDKGGVIYINFGRTVLVVIAACLIVLWMLRKYISAEFAAVYERWILSPPALKSTDVIPKMSPVFLAPFLGMILILWIVFVSVSLVPGHETWAERLSEEHGTLENLTVLFYFFAGFISLKLSFPLWRRGSRRGLVRWWLLILAVGCLLIAFEEINWGFKEISSDISSNHDGVEFIRDLNYQHDVSFHNISLPFIGEYWANDLLQMIAFCGGVMLPLLLRYSSVFRRIVWAGEVPLPPWTSQAYFFIAALIPQDTVIHLHRANIPSELREVTIAFGVAVWLWAVLRNCGLQQLTAQATPPVETKTD